MFYVFYIYYKIIYIMNTTNPSLWKLSCISYSTKKRNLQANKTVAYLLKYS